MKIFPICKIFLLADDYISVSNHYIKQEILAEILKNQR